MNLCLKTLRRTRAFWSVRWCGGLEEDGAELKVAEVDVSKDEEIRGTPQEMLDARCCVVVDL